LEENNTAVKIVRAPLIER